ncbi:MAG: hypothetical protein ACTH69_10700, partial [Halomonas sp.]|uniref:hypothetical protein n=1 Tax=Halomonas sp. TaxID=1486246 RepID=UPI003F914E9A
DDARRLRASYATPEQWPDNSALDPAVIRRRQRVSKQRWLATAAALVLMLGIGLAGGWQMRGLMSPATVLPMADAVQAYRLFANDTVGSALDRNRQSTLLTPMAAGREDIERLFQTYFQNGVVPPDLSAAGLQIADTRLLATEQGPAAVVIYHDQNDQQLMMYIRPPGAGNHRIEEGQRLDGNLLAQYWSQGNYNYAVVSQADNAKATMLEQMLRNS